MNGVTVLLELIKVLPSSLLSRGFGKVAALQQPKFLVRLLQKAFIQATGVNMAEAAEPLEAYASLEALFSRKLDKACRPIDHHSHVVVSPVDGAVGHYGRIENQQLWQIKGQAYSLQSLLMDGFWQQRFAGGDYCTLYLSPKDHHGIYYPMDAEVVAAKLIAGRLLPVFPEALKKEPNLFVRNERLITFIKSKTAGLMAVVKVGATLVGSISVLYDASLRSNIAGSAEIVDRSYQPRPFFHKGEALGTFHMGSTVILLSEANRLHFKPLTGQQSIRFGEPLAHIVEA